MLWNQSLKLFQPHSKDCKLNYLQHIDFEQIYVTAIYTNAAIEEPQHVHIDFTWEVLLLCSRRRRGHVSSNKPGLKHGNMLYTAHMPLSSDGSYIYIYIWSGPGESVPIHIHYGTILFLHGDIVHCGGAPKDFSCEGKKYPRLHFYFLTSAADHPNNSIFHESFVGVPFDKEHYHPWDP